MNEIATTQSLDQADICRFQDAIADGYLPPVELTYRHYFADGIYARVMCAPAGSVVIGKAHRTEHISILLKGSCNIVDDNGHIQFAQAPMIMVSEPNKKKIAYVLTDMEFVNVHPTMTTDLDEIERQVIWPEAEYRTLLIESERITKELAMAKSNQMEVS